MARRKYRVDIGPVAQRDLASTQAQIARYRPRAATKWLQTVRRHVRSLASLPLRYEVIPEIADEEFPFEYRHIAFGNYRIVYRVEPARVLVVRVLHSARLLTPEMLEE